MLPLITLVFLQWRAFQTLKSVAYQNICGAPGTIIGKNGVTKINDGTLAVLSETNAQKLHIVNLVGSKQTCDCERFKSETLCASHQEKVLLHIVSSWEPKLSDLVNS